MKNETDDKFVFAVRNDPLVQSMIRAGASKDAIIGELSERNTALLKQIITLEMLAPRTIVIGGINPEEKLLTN